MADQNRGYEGRILIAGNELTICKDLAHPLTRDQIEDTIRGNNGIKSFEAGQFDYVINLTIANEPDDAEFLVLKNAYFAGTTIDNVDVEDQRDTALAHSILCSLMKVFEFSDATPMDGEQVRTVVLRPARNGTTVPTLTFVEP